MKKIFDFIFSFLGIYLFLIGVIAIINSIVYPEIANFLWLCYASLILIGAGMFFRKTYLIILQLNIIFIPILFWNLDFFYRLFTGKFLFGITEYFFAGGVNSLGNFISLSHVIILPLSVFFLYNYKIKRNDLWMFSFIEIILFFILSFFLTSPDLNTNCVFYSCINFINFTGAHYYFIWFFLNFIMIFITNYFLVKFFSSRKIEG